MDFSKYCNNDLYAGLEKLRDAQKSGNLSCKIVLPNGAEYNHFMIDDTRGVIILNDDIFNSVTMDINVFVDWCINNKIIFKIKNGG
ncbi:MAG: hypothetical protein ACI4DY_11570 [Monoglobaceae bacterium]